VAVFTRSMTIARLRPVARQLAERAIAAADRQVDAQYARSMLFEWGQIAARNGDKATTCNDPADLPTGTIIAVGTVFIGG
jgi:uncharacterized Zn-binding protein involved in type VI secretion